MIEIINKLRQDFDYRIGSVSNSKQLEQIRIEFLGKKGQLQGLMKELRNASPQEKPKLGKDINLLKQHVEQTINDKDVSLGSKSFKNSSENFDTTLPGRKELTGTLHPITQVMEEITSIFFGLGFQVEEGPEIETDYYNFEALNIPKDHPARDMQDTFYIEDETVLRTHTSPVQIHVMENREPPLRIIAPGKVYRCDSDVSHTPMFHQIEGLLVDTNVTMADLKSILRLFARSFFGGEVHIRFRPSFFPFTEPSVEVDMSWHEGWIEMGGAGMVDPNVLTAVGFDPEEVTGLAFGLGVERVCMRRYGITDIRELYENDVRFLQQF